MLLQSLLILAFASLPTYAVPMDNHGINIPNINKQMCGTPPPNQELRDTHSRLHKAKKAGLAEGPEKRSQLVVQLYMHFVSTTDQAHYYTANVRQSLATNQITALNIAYRPAGIVFASKPATYTVRNDWATDANSTAMKQALRQGTYKDLNVYFQTNLSTAPYVYNPASTLLGYCTLPTTITYTNNHGGQTEYPASAYATDGCNVLAGSMPNSPAPIANYNQGKTAVHEIGHWFGMLHTFQDNTCSPSDGGDYIDDTPQEATSTTGCPKGKDSCPNSPGLDPVSNYMDYSTDACYTQFTADQQSRMVAMFNAYRVGK